MAQDTRSNKSALLLGAAVAAAIGLAVITLVPVNEPPAPVAVAGNSAPSEPVPTAVDSVALAPEAATTAPDAPIAPTRETFVMLPDGYATLAGRAAPGADIGIELDGQVVDRVTADAGGRFSVTMLLTPSDQPRVMRLVTDTAQSRETYFVQPVIVPETVATLDSENAVADVDAADIGTDAAPAAALAAGGESAINPTENITENAAVADAATATDASEVIGVVAEAVPSDTTADTATAPGILVSDANGVRVLQPVVSDQAPEVMSTVALDTITYDETGEVLLAGRALGEGSVNIYLNNQPITTSQINPEGDWRIDLPQVDTGVYTLRIDEVTADGDVVSRIETPFKREEAAAVAAVFAEDTANAGFEVAVRTVQPGSTLWAIARDQFGSGVMYVAVFEANRDLIRDPDLIYPGQVFRMPKIDE